VREPYTQLYVHLVWSTWDRLPILTGDLVRPVYACIKAECDKLKAQLIAIGGMSDHVHVLVRLPTTVAIATLVKQLKGSSSHLVNHELSVEGTFRWQEAYGAFTVSKSVGPTVRAYIRNQAEHHTQGTTDKNLEICWAEPAPSPGLTSN